MQTFPQYYIVNGSQGTLHKRDGLDVIFSGIEAKIIVHNLKQYQIYWAGRLEYLKNNEKAD